MEERTRFARREVYFDSEQDLGVSHNAGLEQIRAQASEIEQVLEKIVKVPTEEQARKELLDSQQESGQ